MPQFIGGLGGDGVGPNPVRTGRTGGPPGTVASISDRRYGGGDTTATAAGWAEPGSARLGGYGTAISFIFLPETVDNRYGGVYAAQWMMNRWHSAAGMILAHGDDPSRR